ncbi:MAG: efflux RND transporter periplasmic adaptor subunit [Desulfotomaculaceae bacterium]|nr:efflux RND transporter periplasmic adaptor subunit [Desulfotomaculaceae bacterium]
MKNLKKILIILAVIVLAGGSAGISYYVYESSNYFFTENARVTSDIVMLTPEVTGKLKNWDVKEGDYVKAGQVLGKQDVSMMVTSTAMNPQALAGSADIIISKTDIKSPIDGKVILSNVVQGQVISPGMEIAAIGDTAHIYIKANIEETDIIKIKPGQEVDIKIDAYSNKRFTGYVESIGQATQSTFSQFPSLNTSGTYSKVTQLIPVRIVFTGTEDLPLMFGMNATVKIHINQ